MLVENGVSILEVPIGGFTMNPTLIWDDKNAVLIDTGLPSQGQQILDAIKETGVPIDHVKTVILTHQDIDHIGALPELLPSLPADVQVYAHELDKPYIEGDKKLMKLDLPPQLQHYVENPPKAKVHQVLYGGEKLGMCGGISVIFTPGHTPGHISLYVEKSKTLVAGDSMVTMDGKLHGPVSQTTPDLTTAKESLIAYLNFNIEKVICFHGGLCEEKVSEQIKEIVSMNEQKTNVLK
jgi:glyoxylase-like metal-dependent hydrolase (beta-lactamase superfamily II)